MAPSSPNPGDTDADALRVLTSQLRAHAGAWSRRSGFDADAAARARHAAIRHAHAHHVAHIPAYRRLCEASGVGASADLTELTELCTVTDDVFKSYDATWLEGGDFGAMRRWLADLCAEPAVAAAGALGAEGPDGAAGLDDWLDRFGRAGLELLYSSGTSGKLSFVPRAAATWDAYRGNGPSYLMQRVLDLRLDLARTDALVLGYRGGRMGIQRAGTELARYVTRVDYLYDTVIRADHLHALLTARTPESARAAEEALSGGREAGEAYARVLGRLAEAGRAGRPLWLFGAPHQVMRLCRLAAQAGLAPLPPGSVVNLGGGWKSFAGERLGRTELLALLEAALGVPGERVLEAYAMVELNTPLMRCPHGRYHVPPLLEPVLYDEALLPVPVDGEARGVFGFLDPTALSYPGFIVTGDEVTLSSEPCACGLEGPALVGEIGRATGREVRGCGGIMEAVRA